jgi:hypothetical protein
MGAALALILAVIVALRLATAAPVALPQDTPAGAFQAYLAAYRDGPLETAYEAFSARVQRQMTFDEFDRVATSWRRDQIGRQRIVLEGVKKRGDRATLRLRVETAGDPGLFGRGGYDWETEIRLVRERGAWRIDDALAGLEPMDEW